MADIIKLRRGTAGQWLDSGLILSDGEVGILRTPGQKDQIKIGNGMDLFEALDFVGSDSGGGGTVTSSDIGYIPADLADLLANAGSYANGAWYISNDIDLEGNVINVPAGIHINSAGGSLFNGTIFGLERNKISYDVLRPTTVIGGDMRLIDDYFYFDPVVWGIVQNTDTLVAGETNKDIFNGCMETLRKLKGGTFELAPMDAVIYGTRLTTNPAGSTELGINIPSNVHFKMNEDTVLRHATSNHFSARLLIVFNETNVQITGGRLIGDRDTHDYSPINDENNFPRNTHDFGALIFICGGHNVTVRDVYMYRPAADCILCQRDGLRNEDGSLREGQRENDGVYVINNELDGARRNNFSLTDGKNFVIKGNKIINTGGLALAGAPAQSEGTDPEYGIDIEAYRQVTYTAATATIVVDAQPDEGAQFRLQRSNYGVVTNKTYTFTSSLGSGDGEILIGATVAQTINNMVAAINLGAGSGTDYSSGTTANPFITISYDDISSVITITSKNDTESVNLGWEGNFISFQPLTGFANGGNTALDVALAGGFDNLRQWEKAYQILVEDNDFINNRKGDLHNYSCSEIVIRNNRMGNKISGLVCSDVLIEGNTLICEKNDLATGQGLFGISIANKHRNGVEENGNMRILNNVISGFDVALRPRGINNHISGNTISQFLEGIQGDRFELCKFSNNIWRSDRELNYIISGRSLWVNCEFVNEKFESNSRVLNPLGLNWNPQMQNTTAENMLLTFKGCFFNGAYLNMIDSSRIDFIDCQFKDGIKILGNSKFIRVISCLFSGTPYGGYIVCTGNQVSDIIIQNTVFNVNNLSARSGGAVVFNNGAGATFNVNSRISGCVMYNSETGSLAQRLVLGINVSGLTVLNNIYHGVRELDFISVTGSVRTSGNICTAISESYSVTGTHTFSEPLAKKINGIKPSDAYGNVVLAGESQAFTTELSLTNALGIYDTGSFSAEVAYTTVGTVAGAFVYKAINAASEPGITGSTRIAGDDFVPNTNMHMIVANIGGSVVHKFIKI